MTRRTRPDSLRPVLRRYSRNEDATRELVALLNRWGYAVDARVRYNHVSVSIVEAVKRFQAQHLDEQGQPLAVDGIVGPATWAALLRPVDDAQRIGLGGEPKPLHVTGDPRIPCGSGPVRTMLAAALADYDAGRRETPLGSNITPWLEPRAQGKPWCSFQVHAWIRAALGRFIFAGYRGSTRIDLKRAKAAGLIVDAPVPGDVFVLCAEGRAYHTGLVLRVSGADQGEHVSMIDTVEGNCANRVAIRRRRVTSDVVFWRPFDDLLAFQTGLLPTPVQAAGDESTR